MPHQITKWKCDHCRKSFTSRTYAGSHEVKCFFNTDNKTCPTCEHFNGGFKNEAWKCFKLKRDCESVGGLTLTDFLVYHCPDWKDKYSYEEETT